METYLMSITAISDLHGHYPDLPGGDLLIVAGDLTKSDETYELRQFLRWIRNQNYEKKVFISGNHDNWLIGSWPAGTKGPFGENGAFYYFDYLLDSGTEFEYRHYIQFPALIQNPPVDILVGKDRKLKIWGSPWTKRFEGMNPHCMAFTVETDEELAEKWALIPDDIDILITHCPPDGIMDCVGSYKNGKMEHTGSVSLRKRVLQIKPKLHVFGHIHEYGGQKIQIGTTLFVNASLVDEHYHPLHKRVDIKLSCEFKE
jgi:Icc-related predicted phosphoesterase